MKTLIFQLFICFSMALYSFAGNPTNVPQWEDSTPMPKPTSISASIPPHTSELPPGFVLDKPAQSPRTNELKPREMDWSVSNKASEETTVTQNKPAIPGEGFTWVDEEPVGAVGNLYADILDPIPPPITNGFNVIFPELYNNNHYLVMTNAQYSGRNRRILSFSRFMPTGLKSISLDVTRIHPTILEYLNISRDRVIREDKEIKQRQMQAVINKIEQQAIKLKIQIESITTLDAADQGAAINAAIATMDVIIKLNKAMQATINTMDMTDRMNKISVVSVLERMQTVFDTTDWAWKNIDEINREQSKARSEMAAQKEMIRYQESVKAANEASLARQNRPTSIGANSTEEHIDRWGNVIYTVPRSSVINFNYDKR